MNNLPLKDKLKLIHNDGFNIYMMLNKLKKELRRKENFPDEIIEMFCDVYWKQKPQNNYPYFLKTFKMVCHQYYANQRQVEHKKYKNQKMPDSVKNILKSIIQ